MADDAGFSLVEVARRLFFRIVNQVLVRLWARRWWDVRANGRPPLITALARAEGDREV
jgi:hypothetical protein